MKYDLGFGNSVSVRESFIQTQTVTPTIISHKDLLTFDYTSYQGDLELIEITKQVLKRQTNQDYKHVIITVGATGAINLALSTYKQMGHKGTITRNIPNYTHYSKMITTNGLKVFSEIDPTLIYGPSVVLLDFPSNPLHLTTEISSGLSPVILDGVYSNNIYQNVQIPLPKHDVFIGSYSKLTGLNALRLGFLAVNDDLLFEKLLITATASYCGLNRMEQDFLKQSLTDFDWQIFEELSRFKLDCNREEFTKLEKFFDKPINPNGMFLYTELDQKAQDLFNKAGIIWTKGSTMGSNDSFARFNLGQNCTLIKNAVKDILGLDRL